MSPGTRAGLVVLAIMFVVVPVMFLTVTVALPWLWRTVT